LSNTSLLNNSPEQLRESIEAFIDYYNNRRYHESLDNLTPADVYHSRGERILNLRKEAKKRTIELTILSKRQKRYNWNLNLNDVYLIKRKVHFSF